MKYLLISLLLLSNIVAWTMDYPWFNDIDSFLYYIDADKENCPNDLPYENAACSLEINDKYNLKEFCKLPARCLKAIHKIDIPTINASPKKERALIKFFEDHKDDFTKLTIFISSGLKLGDDFTNILNNIKSLRQVDLIGASLSNNGLLNLLNNRNLYHISVYHNPMISDEVVFHILSMGKTFNDVILVIELSIDNNTKDQLHNLGFNLILF